MMPTSRTQPNRLCAAGLVFVVAVALTAVAYRNGIRLSFDSYYYVEYAKRFRHAVPESFGSSWPFGWPLVGAVLSWTGLSVYSALVLAATASVAGLIVLAYDWVPWGHYGTRDGLIILLSAATLAIIGALVTGVLSETPFAVALLGLASCLRVEPTKGTIAGAAALALAAFGIRYIGIVAFPIVIVWGWFIRGELRRRGLIQWALGCVTAGGLAAATLLTWNWASTGHTSGANLAPGAGLLGLPAVIADFGWSCATAAIGGVAQRWLYDTPGRVLIGILLCLGPILLAVLAWVRPANPTSRVLALLIIAYSTAFITLRCFAAFDSLSARITVPIAFPTILLAAGQFAASRRTLVVVSLGALILVNVTLALRGSSRQIGADVNGAADVLRPIVSDHDVIGINDQAMTLTALIPARVERVIPLDRILRKYTFIVVAAPPLNRAGEPGPFPADWRAAIDRLICDGAYRVRWKSAAVVLLQARTPLPPPEPQLK